MMSQSHSSPSSTTSVTPVTYPELTQYREERPWGCFTVIQDAPYCKVKHLVLLPQQRLSLQYHHHREEHWLITHGTGRVTVGQDQWLVSAGDLIRVPRLAEHRLENTSVDTLLEWVEVQLGDSFEESDIVRLQDDYQRVTDVSHTPTDKLKNA
ncbi:MAG: phosphomannose isomerase type II C-terminal cupin domain [Vampirovibrionales bacterium]